MSSKREHYRRPDVARRYLERRYGGSAGRRVLAREMDCVRALLSRAGVTPGSGGRALDLACGQGRAAAVLAETGRRAFGLDASPAMLAVRPYPGRAVLGDALATPFRSATFDVVLALRFSFHVADLDPLLREVARVLVPGGVLIVETYRWSLLVAGWGPFCWAGGPNIHRTDREVEDALRRAGLEPRARIGAFAAPPSLVRWLGPLSRAVLAAERLVPERLRVAAYWLARRPPREADPDKERRPGEEARETGG